MKSYILSVRPDNDPQLCDLVRSLSEADVEVEVVEGVIGSRMTAGTYFEYAAITHRKFGYLVSPGELACALGHLKILQKIAQSENAFGFVFEDDVILNHFNDARPDIERFVLLTSSDFVHLGGQEGISSRFKLRAIRQAYSCEFFAISSEYLPFLNRTCGYVISRAAAGKLSRALNNGIFKIDDFKMIAGILSVSSLDFIDIVSHPINLDGSLIERERALMAQSVSCGDPLFRRIMLEIQRSVDYRVKVLRRTCSDWRQASVPLYRR